MNILTGSFLWGGKGEIITGRNIEGANVTLFRLLYGYIIQ